MNARNWFTRAWYGLVHHSVESFLAFLCLTASVPILVHPGQLAPTSVLKLLPTWMVYVWAIGFSVGGLLTLLGIVLAHYRVERAGVAALAGVSFVYGVAVASNGHPRALLSVVLYAAFFLTMVARYYVLGRKREL